MEVVPVEVLHSYRESYFYFPQPFHCRINILIFVLLLFFDYI